MMETVKLRTGIEHHGGLVATMHMTCSYMWDVNSLAMFDAVMIARDPSYKPFGGNSDALKNAALLEDSGKMNTSVRELILAFFQGDMLDMVLLGPDKYLAKD